MGMFDTVWIDCPNCGAEHAFQSKGGESLLDDWILSNCPDDVFSDINRHSPHECDCGVQLRVNEQREVEIIK